MGEGISVLIVDDEEVIRNLLIDVLSDDEGCEVTAVANGAEAVVRVKENVFDLVFLDVHMSEVNGVEILKIIKEMGRETKVIMMDSYPDHLLSEAQEIGVLTCLHKPFDIKDVVAVVEEIRLIGR